MMGVCGQAGPDPWTKRLMPNPKVGTVTNDVAKQLKRVRPAR